MYILRYQEINYQILLLFYHQCFHLNMKYIYQKINIPNSVNCCERVFIVFSPVTGVKVFC